MLARLDAPALQIEPDHLPGVNAGRYGQTGEPHPTRLRVRCTGGEGELHGTNGHSAPREPQVLGANLRSGRFPDQLALMEGGTAHLELMRDGRGRPDLVQVLDGSTHLLLDQPVLRTGTDYEVDVQ